ncbi:MAG TPA: glycosyltransferase family 4 protein [bacterium]|nr:glycosyltransferase family 4 protein [bacterium]
MKILLVHPHLNFYGGAELVVDKLSQYLLRNGHECVVATLSVSPEMRKRLSGLEFITSKRSFSDGPKSTSLKGALSLFGEIFELRRLIKAAARNFDVINVHNFPTTWAAAGVGKPVIWMCNEPPDLWNNPNPGLALKIIRVVGGFVDRLIVRRFIVTSVVADENNGANFEKRYGKVPAIDNYGIDYAFFSQGKKNESLIKKYGLSDKFVLIQVGMLTEPKNQLDTLKAFLSVSKKVPRAVLVLAGKGGTDYEQKLISFIESNNISDRVIFTGQVDQGVVRDLYASADLALFPVKTQGGWLSPFEALSAGVPVVVYPTMGAAAVIEKNKLGTVSPDLAKAIMINYRDRKAARERARQSQIWIRDNLIWDNFGGRMVDVFRCLWLVRD